MFSKKHARLNWLGHWWKKEMKITKLGSATVIIAEFFEKA